MLTLAATSQSEQGSHVFIIGRPKGTDFDPKPNQSQTQHRQKIVKLEKL